MTGMQGITDRCTLNKLNKLVWQNNYMDYDRDNTKENIFRFSGSGNDRC